MAACAALVAISACSSVSPSNPATVPSATADSLALPSSNPGAASTSPNAPTASSEPVSIRVARAQADLPSPRSRAAALVFQHTVLLCGGLTGAGTTTGSILRIDLPAGQSTPTGQLAAPVHDAGAAWLGSLALVFGGGRLGPGSVVQRVDATGTSAIVGHLPADRADLAAIAIDRQFLVVGGGTPTRPDRTVLATSDGTRFRTVATLAVGVRYPAVIVAAGWLYVIGGGTPAGDLTDIQAVDPTTGSVRIVGHLPHGLSHASTLVVGGEVLIAGGRRNGQVQDELWRLDTASGVVVRVGQLPYPVSDAAAVVVDGVGYLIGGEGTAGPLAAIVSLTAQ